MLIASPGLQRAIYNISDIYSNFESIFEKKILMTKLETEGQ